MAKPKTSKSKFIEVCERIAVSDKGLAKICKEVGVSTLTFYKWLDESELNQKQYARAREAQADLLADQILEIADDSSQDTMTIKKGKEEIDVENTEWVNRSKLRVDARKWVAAKLKPKKYSEKMDITSDNEKLSFISPDTIAKIANKINGNSK